MPLENGVSVCGKKLKADVFLFLCVFEKATELAATQKFIFCCK